MMHVPEQREHQTWPPPGPQYHDQTALQTTTADVMLDTQKQTTLEGPGSRDVHIRDPVWDILAMLK